MNVETVALENEPQSTSIGSADLESFQHALVPLRFVNYENIRPSMQLDAQDNRNRSKRATKQHVRTSASQTMLCTAQELFKIPVTWVQIRSRNIAGVCDCAFRLCLVNLFSMF